MANPNNYLPILASTQKPDGLITLEGPARLYAAAIHTTAELCLTKNDRLSMAYGAL
jgi:hypothetical protein